MLYRSSDCAPARPASPSRPAPQLIIIPIFWQKKPGEKGVVLEAAERVQEVGGCAIHVGLVHAASRICCLLSCPSIPLPPIHAHATAAAQPGGQVRHRHHHGAHARPKVQALVRCRCRRTPWRGLPAAPAGLLPAARCLPSASRCWCPPHLPLYPRTFHQCPPLQPSTRGATMHPAPLLHSERCPCSPPTPTGAGRRKA